MEEEDGDGDGSGFRADWEYRKKALSVAVILSILSTSLLMPYIKATWRRGLYFESVTCFFLSIVSVTFYVHEANDKASAYDGMYYSDIVHFDMHWIQWQRVMSMLAVLVSCSVVTLCMQNDNRSIDELLHGLYFCVAIILFERDQWATEHTIAPVAFAILLWGLKVVVTRKKPQMDQREAFRAVILWVFALLFYFVSYKNELQHKSMVRPVHHAWHALAAVAMLITLKTAAVTDRTWHQQLYKKMPDEDEELDAGSPQPASPSVGHGRSEDNAAGQIEATVIGNRANQ